MSLNPLSLQAQNVLTVAPERPHTANDSPDSGVKRSMEILTQPIPTTTPLDFSQARAQEAVRDEFMKTVADSLEHLPLRQRQVVTMRYYESRSLEEISELLDIREMTVRTLLRHGVNNLRRHFKRSYLDPD